jgi:transposase
VPRTVAAPPTGGRAAGAVPTDRRPVLRVVRRVGRLCARRHAARQGIGYARKQRDALRRFLDDGGLPLHNNASELQLRREVIGRRNWWFVGSDEAAEVNTTFVSLLARCGLHQLEPWALPPSPAAGSSSSSPPTGKQTCEDADAQRRVAADPFRAATLALDRPHRDTG